MKNQTNTNRTLRKIALGAVLVAAQTGTFLSFTYKNVKGEESKRTFRFGGDIAAKFERDGKPVGQGGKNWITDGSTRSSGIRACVLRRKGVTYVRGTDLKDSVHKTLILDNITVPA